MANSRKCKITYKKGNYKYQLEKDYCIQTHIQPEKPIQELQPFIHLNSDGMLHIYKGYAWDGPSGPTFDTKSFMRGSLVHDALYQLMRHEYLSTEKWRKEADYLLKQICLEDGMRKLRAWWVHLGVRCGGGPSASPKKKRKIKKAP